MSNRYNKTNKFYNNSNEYSEILERKGIKGIEQYETFKTNFSKFDKNLISHTIHVYKKNEKLYNISKKYYGSPEYYWIIMLTNEINDLFSLKDGFPLKIYFPIQSILEAL